MRLTTDLAARLTTWLRDSLLGCVTHLAAWLTTLNWRSIASLSNFPSSWAQTSVAYQFWNFFYKNSFAALVTLKSKGCSQSVQLGGIRTTSTLWLSSNFSNFLCTVLWNYQKVTRQDGPEEFWVSFWFHWDMAKWFWWYKFPWSLRWTSGLLSTIYSNLQEIELVAIT